MSQSTQSAGSVQCAPCETRVRRARASFTAFAIDPDDSGVWLVVARHAPTGQTRMLVGNWADGDAALEQARETCACVDPFGPIDPDGDWVFSVERYDTDLAGAAAEDEADPDEVVSLTPAGRNALSDAELEEMRADHEYQAWLKIQNARPEDLEIPPLDDDLNFPHMQA